jgi:hypothetical protein
MLRLVVDFDDDDGCECLASVEDDGELSGMGWTDEWDLVAWVEVCAVKPGWCGEVVALGLDL